MGVRIHRKVDRELLCKNLVTLILLAGALLLVGLSASYGTQEQLSKLPQVVLNTFRSMAGAI